MKGFKDFVLRGNLVELAVAFIMATAFASVVTAMVAVIMDVIGKAGGTPDFADYNPGGVSIGAFLTALVSFVVLAVVVYFGIVMPYTKARQHLDRSSDEMPESAPEDIMLLTEIRDLLTALAPPPDQTPRP